MTLEDSASQAYTYAIGDLHGEITLLYQLLELMPYQKEDTLVFLGDYMDRGEDSLGTIAALRALHNEHENCIFIRGNHDDTWLYFWDGAKFTRQPVIPGARKVWDSCKGKVPFEVGHWLEGTRFDYEDEHAYYVHAGVMPNRPFSMTPNDFKMWGVDGFLESLYRWEKPVVFGHYHLPKPMVQPNKIGVDTGAWKSGVLTAVRMPDRQIFQAKKENKGK